MPPLRSSSSYGTHQRRHCTTAAVAEALSGILTAAAVAASAVAASAVAASALPLLRVSHPPRGGGRRLGRSNSFGRVSATDYSRPIQPTDSSRPTQPTDSSRPIQPTDSADRLQPTDSSQPI